MSSHYQDLLVFFSLVALAATWVVVHLQLCLRVAREKKLAWPWRLLACLPPATPVVGFVAGVPFRSVLWVVLAAGYIVLRTRS